MAAAPAAAAYNPPRYQSEPGDGGPDADYRTYEPHHRRATSLLTPPAPDQAATLPRIWSNGGSANVVISQDNRDARLIAFDSESSKFVAGDSNGVRDVFVLRRGKGAANFSGRIALGSVAGRAGAANGPSSHPSLDGDTWHAPHCVAFDSRATNLVRGDRSTDADVYVRDLGARRTVLVSPGLRDAQAPVIDGSCTTVVYSARGSVWIARVKAPRPQLVARGDDPDMQTNGRGVAYVRHGQVWYRSIELSGNGLVRERERLVSMTARTRPGNGRSSNPALDDRGYYVAFESTASNLCVRQCNLRDTNGAISDVFRRTLSRRAPTHDHMQIVSMSRSGVLQPGPSSNPVISANGENVIFDSEAFMTRGGGNNDSYNPNGAARSLYTWTYPHARAFANVSAVQPRPHCYRGCRSAEEHPAMSSRGNYVAYLAQMSEFCNPTPFFHFAGERTDCPQYEDVFVTYMGRSHEGQRLG